MRKSLLLSLTLILLTAITATAQRGSRPDPSSRMASEAARKRQEFNQDQMELRSLEVNSKVRAPDPLMALQIQVNNDLKQLSDFTNALLVLVNGNNNAKEIADLSNKIAKLSKRLRQELNVDNDKRKIEAIPLPPEDDRPKRMHQLAELIDKLADQVNDVQVGRVYNASKTLDTGSQLLTIELQAVTLRTLAKAKN